MKAGAGQLMQLCSGGGGVRLLGGGGPVTVPQTAPPPPATLHWSAVGLGGLTERYPWALTSRFPFLGK